MNSYESQDALDQYLLFHYGTVDETDPRGLLQISSLGFAQRSITENVDTKKLRVRALDLGCAVGRSSFEMSYFCDEVIGIDNSKTFVKAAEMLRRNGSLRYRSLEEGMFELDLTARIPTEAQPKRIQFEVGDAMSLREDLGNFDIVHTANLLCRLPEPQKLLDRLPMLVSEGGLLIITTPCTWLGEFTPKENWPNGPTLDWLKNKLSTNFVLEKVSDMPFIIREHARKFQFGIAQATVWCRYCS